MSRRVAHSDAVGYGRRVGTRRAELAAAAAGVALMLVAALAC